VRRWRCIGFVGVPTLLGAAVPCGFFAFAAAPLTFALIGRESPLLMSPLVLIAAVCGVGAGKLLLRGFAVVWFAVVLGAAAGVAAAAMVLVFSGPDEEIDPRWLAGGLGVLLAAITGVAACAGGLVSYFAGRRARFLTRGRCPRCLYDLRGISGVCPECAA
jgi:hypothetical protein